MVREDLVTSAVSFLQDPSVASAPIEKRIAFLQSKNLTQEEVDLSLARAAEDSSQSSSAASSSAGSQYAPRSSPPTELAYGGYPPQSYWQPPPPPEPPKRDWRDYFIMATVMGGVGYGMYFTAKRYIMPLVLPPTPHQLEQDKASIDESFQRAFDLLEQLNTDTTALKASEEARTKKLDTTLTEVETVLAALKDASKRQGDDNRRIEDDVRGLRDLIPKALDAQKASTDNRLKELSTELKSLKTLVGSRIGAGAARPPAAAPSYYGTAQSQSPAPTPNGDGLFSASAPAQQSTSLATPASSQHPNASAPTDAQAAGSTASSSTPSTEKPASAPYSKLPAGRAAIPAWQMAAAKKNEEAKKDTSESGTVADAAPSA